MSKKPSLLIENAGSDGLEKRLLRWALHWENVPEAALNGKELATANERLHPFVEKLFGCSALARMKGEPSPESSLIPVVEPMFRAFVGRRAARELVRRSLLGI